MEVRNQILSRRSILLHFLFFPIFQPLSLQSCIQEVAVLMRSRESEQMSIKELVNPWFAMMQMLASKQPKKASISARDDVLTRHLGITSVDRKKESEEKQKQKPLQHSVDLYLYTHHQCNNESPCSFSSNSKGFLFAEKKGMIFCQGQ